MKVMTFNILEGGDAPIGGRADRREVIARVIRQADPDVVALQECNGWEKDNQSVLREFEGQVGMVALLGVTDGFPVGLLVKPRYQILHAGSKSEGFWHGMLDVVVTEPENETTRIINVHLHPRDPDLKAVEIKELLAHYREGQRTIILGDLNSLSHLDNLDPSELAAATLLRHTVNGQLDFRVSRALEEAGFTDAYAALHPGNPAPTIPTRAAQDAEFSPVRMDYVYVSNELRNELVSAQVLQTEDTDIASDHYPLLLEIADGPVNGRT